MNMHQASDGRAIVIPMTGPVESTFNVRGQRIRLRTWTRAQWERTPEADRPPVAWAHGDGMAAIAPAD